MAMRYLKPVLSLCSVLAPVAMLAPAYSYAVTGPGGPFLGLSGQWSGAGTITMADGSTARLRCKAANTVNANGRAILKSLSCASDSYKLDISSNVASEGGSLSGSWAESTRGVSGNISGRASGSAIIAKVAGSGFTASINVRTQGDKQSVTIRPKWN